MTTTPPNLTTGHHPIRLTPAITWALMATTAALRPVSAETAILGAAGITLWIWRRYGRYAAYVAALALIVAGLNTHVHAGIALAYATWQTLDHYRATIALDDHRIIRRSGILGDRIDTLPLRALTDLRYDRTPLGRLFGYGHFYVESAGQDQALREIRYVPTRAGLYEAITDATTDPQHRRPI